MWVQVGLGSRNTGKYQKETIILQYVFGGFVCMYDFFSLQRYSFIGKCKVVVGGKGVGG